MKVLFAATEAAPWLKVGGLGDVVGSLPRSLRALGADVRIALPVHGGVLRSAPGVESLGWVHFAYGGGTTSAEVFESKLDGVPVYLIGSTDFDPDGLIYTGDMRDEGMRFTHFALAALELCRSFDWHPDVLHAHDWHTASAVYRLAERRQTETRFSSLASLLSIHNLPYGGDGAQQELWNFGVWPSEDPRLTDAQSHLPLALGLISADALGLVSPGYADEVMTAEHGCGFERLLRSRRKQVFGILNGLDVAHWDPQSDPALHRNYDREHRSDRKENKRALQQNLGLPVSERTPIIAIVSRLVAQKGVDIAVEALRRLVREDWQAVILGTGDPHLEREVMALQRDLPDRVRVELRFDEPQSRRIFGGSDLLLMPSRYEPCGMTQMIGMRYGCIPVGRETGGLADTIGDLDLSDSPTGVLFPDATASSVVFGVRRALARYHRPAEWDALVENAMGKDFSWERSARAYMVVYESIVRARN